VTRWQVMRPELSPATSRFLLALRAPRWQVTRP